MKEEKIIFKIYRSALVPLLMIIIIWSIKLMENLYGGDLGQYGILPGEVSGLRGIVTSPFIHADYSHLLNNSVPLLVSGSLLFFFFEKVSLRVFVLVFLISGLFTWLIGRGHSFHIGASGGVYGLVSFVFMAGILSGEKNLTAISMLMAFLYGSMVWGILPIDYKISWEGHLSGAFAGVSLALILRKQLPQAVAPTVQKFDQIPDIIGDAWMTDEQKAQMERSQSQTSTTPVRIIYFYTPKSYNHQENKKE